MFAKEKEEKPNNNISIFDFVWGHLLYRLRHINRSYSSTSVFHSFSFLYFFFFSIFFISLIFTFISTQHSENNYKDKKEWKKKKITKISKQFLRLFCGHSHPSLLSFCDWLRLVICVCVCFGCKWEQQVKWLINFNLVIIKLPKHFWSSYELNFELRSVDDFRRHSIKYNYLHEAAAATTSPKLIIKFVNCFSIESVWRWIPLCRGFEIVASSWQKIYHSSATQYSCIEWIKKQKFSIDRQTIENH